MNKEKFGQKSKDYRIKIGEIKEKEFQSVDNWLIEENLIGKEDLQISRKDMKLSPGNSIRKKQAEEEEEENRKKDSLWLTTWTNRETGKILAFSLGVNGRGTEVHDISHLNLSLDEFMQQAGSIINSSSSYADAKKAIEDKFSASSSNSYSSFDEYEQLHSSSMYKTPKPSPFKDGW